ncbi:hypothetical protein [Acidianus brierleyi]|uniref:Nickel/cobalt efflux system n=1 Tax=Acidianus brierleyi TaxID=41673 RepID=A0A2U9IIQ6_9CREN|nr:hypothetical protein [Acidianus brierleyi]AWR95917.1 hypothetical protein DFR85_05535 [Acidianus brierleyi]
MDIIYSFIIVFILGLTHGLDPDHIVTARILKKVTKIFKFSLFHSAGFLIIALPISLLLFVRGVKFIIIFVSYIIGIIISLLLLYGSIIGKEFEIEPKKFGLLQGALVLTPSKILTIVLAIASGNVIIGLLIIAIFILTSVLSITIFTIINFIPKKYDKITNIMVSIFSLSYIIYNLIFLF